MKHTANAIRASLFAGAVLTVLALFFTPRLQAQTVDNTNASFFGNSYTPGNGGPINGLWVEDQTDASFELPNGTVFLNSVYDEYHRPAAIYTSAGLANVQNNGFSGPVTAAFTDLYGQGRGGGGGVTADATNVYLAVQQQGYYISGAVGYPSNNCEIWQTARKYDQTGSIVTNANLKGPNGYDGSMIIVSKTQVANPPNYQNAWVSGHSYSQYQTVLYNGGFWESQLATGNASTPSTANNWALYSCNPGTLMPDGSHLTYTNITGRLMGLTILNSKLYAVDRTIQVGAGNGGTDLVASTLRVFDLTSSTFAELSSQEINLNTTGVITAMTSRASDNTLWLAVTRNGPSDTTTPTILRVTAPAGTVTPTLLDMNTHDLSDPAALAFDTTNQLMVGDNGTHQQVLFYTTNTSNLAGVAGFGIAGGTGGSKGSVNRGTTGANKFEGITGIGMDSSGNLSVVTDGTGKYHILPINTDPRYPTPRQGDISGTVLSFFKATSPYVYSLTSQYQGNVFVTTADIDTSTDTDTTAQLYTASGGYNFTYPAPGGTATWSQFANTLDPVTYPQDPRLWLGSATPILRRLNNGGKSQLFMYTLQQNPGLISIFRFDGNVAVPAGMISFEDTSTYPLGHPAALSGDAKDPWTWLDADGSGSFTASTFTSTGSVNTFKGNNNSTPKVNPGHAGGWFVEPTTGDIWATITGTSDQGKSIFHFPLQGFNSAGDPIYGDWATAEAIAIPALSKTHADPTPVTLTPSEQSAYFSSGSGKCPPPPLTMPTTCGDLCSVTHLIYDKSSDVMFLSGYTATDIAAGLQCGASPQSPGPTVIRYNTWSSTPTVAWKQAIPYVTTTGQGGYLGLGFVETLTQAFNSANGPGAYLFIGYSFDYRDNTPGNKNQYANGGGYTGTVLPIRTDSGLAPDGSAPGTNLSQALERGATNVGNYAGVVDAAFATNAHLRGNGSYDLFTEDDAFGKIIVQSNVIH